MTSIDFRFLFELIESFEGMLSSDCDLLPEVLIRGSHFSITLLLFFVSISRLEYF